MRRHPSNNLVHYFHWPRNQHKQRLMVKIRPRNKPNYALPPAYNYTHEKLLSRGETGLHGLANHTTFGNHSALFAKNDFLKKSNMLNGVKGDGDHVGVGAGGGMVGSSALGGHSFTTVLVISSMFLFFTVSLTAALLVFCRKKNSVFALQKCEEEDEEDGCMEEDGEHDQYELEELQHTDVEYEAGEYESGGEISGRRGTPSSSVPPDSPLHQPLMGAASNVLGALGTYDSDDPDPEADHQRLINHDHQPPGAGCVDSKHYNTYSSMSSRSHDQRGLYQRMVVTTSAVMENVELECHQRESIEHEVNPDSLRAKVLDKLQKKYDDFAQITHADIEGGDLTAYPMRYTALNHQQPVISIAYTDEPPSYDSLSYHSPTEDGCGGDIASMHQRQSRSHQYSKLPYVELTEIPVKEQCTTCKSCNVFVTLPEITAAPPQAPYQSRHAVHYAEGVSPVLFVDLPPKSRTESPHTETHESNTSSHTSSSQTNTPSSAPSPSSSTPSYCSTPLSPSSATAHPPYTVPSSASSSSLRSPSCQSISVVLDTLAEINEKDEKDRLLPHAERRNTTNTAVLTELPSLIQHYQLSKTQISCTTTSSSPISSTGPVSSSKSPRRPSSVSLSRQESGVADLLSPMGITPLSPPPGFRNDDCFPTTTMTPSSTDDSGVMNLGGSGAGGDGEGGCLGTNQS